MQPHALSNNVSCGCWVASIPGRFRWVLFAEQTAVYARRLAAMLSSRSEMAPLNSRYEATLGCSDDMPTCAS
jgi:hypothetical protein